MFFYSKTKANGFSYRDGGREGKRKGRENEKNPPKPLSSLLPLRPGALLGLRGGLGARPTCQEQPREQQHVSRDQGREREAQTAPGEVEGFAHVFFF